MIERIKTTDPASSEPEPESETSLTPRTISHPREVAAVVMARMNQVNVKKDELGDSVDGLMEVMQQLTKIHEEQLLAMEQLRRRVKALESGVAGGASHPAPPAK
jgi:hypothetical protein